MPQVGIFPSNPTKFSPEKIPDQTGKVIIVTGGNTGIGFQTTLQLIKKGAHVYLAARNPTRAQEAINNIKNQVPNAKITHLLLDLTDLKQVQKAANEFKSKETRLDVLINNAGIMAGPFALTKDGIEEQFGTNHLGHFLFTRELIPTLLQTKDSRIVNVSSVAHTAAPAQGILFDSINDEKVMNNWDRYGQSKLANLLFSAGLHKRFGDSIWINSVHPGWVRTELLRGTEKSSPFLAKIGSFLGYFLGLDPLRGAYTSLYVATSPDIITQKLSNKYFIPLANNENPSDLATNSELAETLWEFSESLCNEKLK